MNAANDSDIDADLLAHERTYLAFNILLRWSILGLSAGLTVLKLGFATPIGFLGGLIAGYCGLVRHEVRQPLDP